ncbi:MAG: hypothetical protein ACRDRS_21410 [Pseudonocardiaceae bacterium]
MSANTHSAACVNLEAEPPAAVLAQLTDINPAIAWFNDWTACLAVRAAHR